MGKKRAYCPYCDVFLVHNSLRSRRDHNEGWRHIAAFQTYYARFFQQHDRSGGLLDNLDDARDDIPAPKPAAKPCVLDQAPAAPIAPPPISVPQKDVPKPPAIVLPPRIPVAAAPRAPPQIRIGPPQIRPPTIKKE
jgi:hypothetical protein